MNYIDRLEIEERFENEMWQKIKSDWNPSIMDDHFFTDEKKKIIAGKIQNNNFVIAYFHFHHAETNELLSYKLVQDLNLFSKEIVTIMVSKNLFPVKMSIITPYKLSSFPDIDIHKIDISTAPHFGYMTIFPNYDKSKFNLQIDEDLLKRI